MKFDRNKLILISAFVLVFIANQRFLLNEIYHYIVIIPLSLSMLAKNKCDRLMFLIIALLCIADKGGFAYPDTPSTIKYMIYIWSTIVLFLNLRFTRGFLFIVISTLIFYTGISIYNSSYLDAEIFMLQMFSVFIWLTLISILFGFTTTNWSPSDSLFLVSASAIIASDLLNSFFYNSYEYYLSHNPLRFLIFLPLVYLLTKRRFFSFLLILLPTLYLSALYQTRANFLLGFLSVIIVALAGLDRRNFKIFITSVFIILILSNSYEIQSNFRIFDAFHYLDKYEGVELLEILDPVRYREYILYFSQSITDILIGNGPGVGVLDQNQILTSYNLNTSAFSREEISSGVFYKFHDLMLIIAFPFGAIFLFILLLSLVNFMISIRGSKNASAVAVFLGIFLGSYSLSTLILIVFLSLSSYRHWKANEAQ